MLRVNRDILGVCGMSAVPPKADIVERDRHVRFVPKADIAKMCALRVVHGDQVL